MSSITNTIADLIREGGAAQARGIAQRGQILGNAFSNIGQTIGSIPAQIQQRQAVGQQNEMRNLEIEDVRARAAARKKAEGDVSAIDEAMQSGDADRAAIIQRLTQTGRGHLVPALQKIWADADKYGAEAKKASQDAAERQNDYFASLATGIKSMAKTPEELPGAFDIALKHAEQLGYDTSQERAMVQSNPEQLPKVLDALIARSPKFAPKQAANPTAATFAAELSDPDPVKVARAKAALAALQAPQTAAAQAAAANTAADNARADQQLKISQAHLSLAQQQANKPAVSATSDVKEAISGMKDGTIPPQMPGRASKDYTAIMAEAHRQGFDLAGAATDWAATQKHIATLNGAQQTRLNQSINALPDLLDSVDTLASKWKGGRFPILNRANLSAAKNGVYGSDVASVARQLDTQIADVVGDLGTVYMGGNSPTDHAIELAKTALGSDWDEKVLHDMVKLAKSNVGIRKNSIRNTGVQGASENNIYAPKPQVQPTGRYDPITGTVK